MAEISLVPSLRVHEVWPVVEPLLAPALDRATGRWTTGDLFMMLASGQCCLWIVYDDEIFAAITTRVYDTPQKRICCFEWIGGTRMDEWFIDALDLIREYALDLGCSKLEGWGRRGWKRMLEEEGWKELAISYEMDITR